jgi:subtilisin-like proprotein convertase family protein
MKHFTSKTFTILTLLIIMLSGLYCTKLDDPIRGWGNKVSIETGGLNGPATSSSVNIANSTVSCRVSTLAGKRKGICWSESSSNVTVAGSKVEVGTGTGSFSATITGLSPVKTYYYRAYIILAEPNSALYGDLKSFTTPAGCPSFTFSGSPTPTTASFVLNITSNGGATVTSCGVVYSNSVSNPIIGQANCFNAPLTSTPVIGNNNISVSGLTQATTYYVRAWAVNSAGTCYSAPIPVTTTANLATLSTSQATLVTSNSATLGGTITSDGGTAITQRGVVYSSSVSNPTVLDNSPTTGAAGCISVLANPPTGTSSFSIPVTGLTSSVRYYVRAWAKNSASVVSYGGVQPFDTPAQIVCPTIVTSAATLITSTSATLNGTISATGGAPIVEQGFVYSNSNSNPTVGAAGCTFVSYTPVGIAPYNRNITGLTASSTYYFKACARNSTTWCYGAVASFPTGSSISSVTGSNFTSVAVPDNSATGASSSINITIPSGRTITGISVTYNMTHSYASDMVFNLRAPNGQILNLFNRHGTTGANFVNTTINSTSTANLSLASAPFTNTYAPARAIGVGPTNGVSAASAYSNLYSTGTGVPQTWTLLMRDYFQLDVGTLTSWSITITYN